MGEKGSDYYIVEQGNRCPAVPYVLPFCLRLDGGMDLSGNFVAFSGKKQDPCAQIEFNHYYLVGSRIITHVPCNNSYYIIGTILNKITVALKVLRYCCIQANHTSKFWRTGK